MEELVRKRRNESIFPWVKVIRKELSKSFPENSKEMMQLLLEYVHEEFKNLSDGKDKMRAKVLYRTLTNYYLHFRWKAHWNKKRMKLLLVQMLYYLIYLGLILSDGVTTSQWMDQILILLKTFPGDIYLICDSLLLICNIKKKYRQTYASIIQNLLFKENIRSPPDVESFIKVLLLFRRLKFLPKEDITKSSILSVALELKCPSNFDNWVHLNCGNFGGINSKNAAKKFLNKKLKPSILKKLFKVLFEIKYPERLVNLSRFENASVSVNEKKDDKEKKSFTDVAICDPKNVGFSVNGLLNHVICDKSNKIVSVIYDSIEDQNSLTILNGSEKIKMTDNQNDHHLLDHCESRCNNQSLCHDYEKNIFPKQSTSIGKTSEIEQAVQQNSSTEEFSLVEKKSLEVTCNENEGKISGESEEVSSSYIAFSQSNSTNFLMGSHAYITKEKSGVDPAQAMYNDTVMGNLDTTIKDRHTQNFNLEGILLKDNINYNKSNKGIPENISCEESLKSVNLTSTFDEANIHLDSKLNSPLMVCSDLPTSPNHREIEENTKSQYSGVILKECEAVLHRLKFNDADGKVLQNFIYSTVSDSPVEEISASYESEFSELPPRSSQKKSKILKKKKIKKLVSDSESSFSSSESVINDKTAVKTKTVRKRKFKKLLVKSNSDPSSQGIRVTNMLEEKNVSSDYTIKISSVDQKDNPETTGNISPVFIPDSLCQEDATSGNSESSLSNNSKKKIKLKALISDSDCNLSKEKSKILNSKSDQSKSIYSTSGSDGLSEEIQSPNVNCNNFTHLPSSSPVISTHRKNISKEFISESDTDSSDNQSLKIGNRRSKKHFIKSDSDSSYHEVINENNVLEHSVSLSPVIPTHRKNISKEFISESSTDSSDNQLLKIGNRRSKKHFIKSDSDSSYHEVINENNVLEHSVSLSPVIPTHCKNISKEFISDTDSNDNQSLGKIGKQKSKRRFIESDSNSSDNQQNKENSVPENPKVSGDSTIKVTPIKLPSLNNSASSVDPNDSPGVTDNSPLCIADSICQEGAASDNSEWSLSKSYSSKKKRKFKMLMSDSESNLSNGDTLVNHKTKLKIGKQKCKNTFTESKSELSDHELVRKSKVLQTANDSSVTFIKNNNPNCDDFLLNNLLCQDANFIEIPASPHQLQKAKEHVLQYDKKLSEQSVPEKSRGIICASSEISENFQDSILNDSQLCTKDNDLKNFKSPVCSPINLNKKKSNKECISEDGNSFGNRSTTENTEDSFNEVSKKNFQHSSLKGLHSFLEKYSDLNNVKSPVYPYVDFKTDKLDTHISKSNNISLCEVSVSEDVRNTSNDLNPKNSDKSFIKSAPDSIMYFSGNSVSNVTQENISRNTNDNNSFHTTEAPCQPCTSSDNSELSSSLINNIKKKKKLQEKRKLIESLPDFTDSSLSGNETFQNIQTQLEKRTLNKQKLKIPSDRNLNEHENLHKNKVDMKAKASSIIVIENIHEKSQSETFIHHPDSSDAYLAYESHSSHNSCDSYFMKDSKSDSYLPLCSKKQRSSEVANSIKSISELESKLYDEPRTSDNDKKILNDSDVVISRSNSVLRHMPILSQKSNTLSNLKSLCSFDSEKQKFSNDLQQSDRFVPKANNSIACERSPFESAEHILHDFNAPNNLCSKTMPGPAINCPSKYLPSLNHTGNVSDSDFSDRLLSFDLTSVEIPSSNCYKLSLSTDMESKSTQSKKTQGNLVTECHNNSNCTISKNKVRKKKYQKQQKSKNFVTKTDGDSSDNQIVKITKKQKKRKNRKQQTSKCIVKTDCDSKQIIKVSKKQQETDHPDEKVANAIDQETCVDNAHICTSDCGFHTLSSSDGENSDYQENQQISIVAEEINNLVTFEQKQENISKEFLSDSLNNIPQNMSCKENMKSINLTNNFNEGDVQLDSKLNSSLILPSSFSARLDGGEIKKNTKSQYSDVNLKVCEVVLEHLKFNDAKKETLQNFNYNTTSKVMAAESNISDTISSSKDCCPVSNSALALQSPKKHYNLHSSPKSFILDMQDTSVSERIKSPKDNCNNFAYSSNLSTVIPKHRKNIKNYFISESDTNSSDNQSLKIRKQKSKRHFIESDSNSSDQNKGNNMPKNSNVSSDSIIKRRKYISKEFISGSDSSVSDNQPLKIGKQKSKRHFMESDSNSYDHQNKGNNMPEKSKVSNDSTINIPCTNLQSVRPPSNNSDVQKESSEVRNNTSPVFVADSLCQNDDTSDSSELPLSILSNRIKKRKFKALMPDSENPLTNEETWINSKTKLKMGKQSKKHSIKSDSGSSDHQQNKKNNVPEKLNVSRDTVIQIPSSNLPSIGHSPSNSASPVKKCSPEVRDNTNPAFVADCQDDTTSDSSELPLSILCNRVRKRKFKVMMSDSESYLTNEETCINSETKLKIGKRKSKNHFIESDSDSADHQQNKENNIPEKPNVSSDSVNNILSTNTPFIRVSSNSTLSVDQKGNLEVRDNTSPVFVASSLYEGDAALDSSELPILSNRINKRFKALMSGSESTLTNEESLINSKSKLKTEKQKSKELLTELCSDLGHKPVRENNVSKETNVADDITIKVPSFRHFSCNSVSSVDQKHSPEITDNNPLIVVGSCGANLPTSSLLPVVKLGKHCDEIEFKQNEKSLRKNNQVNDFKDEKLNQLSCKLQPKAVFSDFVDELKVYNEKYMKDSVNNTIVGCFENYRCYLKSAIKLEGYNQIKCDGKCFEKISNKFHVDTSKQFILISDKKIPTTALYPVVNLGERCDEKIFRLNQKEKEFFEKEALFSDIPSKIYKENKLDNYDKHLHKISCVNVKEQNSFYLPSEDCEFDFALTEATFSYDVAKCSKANKLLNCDKLTLSNNHLRTKKAVSKHQTQNIYGTNKVQCKRTQQCKKRSTDKSHGEKSSHKLSTEGSLNEGSISQDQLYCLNTVSKLSRCTDSSINEVFAKNSQNNVIQEKTEKTVLFPSADISRDNVLSGYELRSRKKSSDPEIILVSD